MKLLHTAVMLTILLAMGGCVTDGLSMRAAQDPQLTLDRNSRIFLDPYRDVEISHRSYMEPAFEVAKAEGLNIVEQENAQYVMYLNFRRGIKYRPGNDQLEQQVRVQSTSTSVEVGQSRYVNYGVINAGIFEVNNTQNRSIWEAMIEVKDITDREEVERSFRLLFRNLGQNVRGRVVE